MPKISIPGRPLSDGATALRSWRESDIPALSAACQDPQIPRWTRVPSPYGEAEARLYLHQRYDSLRSGTSAPFAVVAPDDGPLLGSISLLRFAWVDARAEVGYFLAREARGKGHAVRAVRLICGWGFGTLGLERIDLLVATGNAASQRVAERAGFTREAVLRAYYPSKHGRLDMVAYGLLVGELGG